MITGALLLVVALVAEAQAQLPTSTGSWLMMKRQNLRALVTPPQSAEEEQNDKKLVNSMIANNPSSLAHGKPEEETTVSTTSSEKKTDAKDNTYQKTIPGYPGTIDPLKVEETEVDRKQYNGDWDTEWKLGAPRKPSVPVENSTHQAEKNSSGGGERKGWSA